MAAALGLSQGKQTTISTVVHMNPWLGVTMLVKVWPSPEKCFLGPLDAF